MRIRQLDLLRYGHFTDAIIALPEGKPDFQMLLGENEAGECGGEAFPALGHGLWAWWFAVTVPTAIAGDDP